MTERTISQMVDEQLNKQERGSMPERTLTQATKEFEQLSAEITSLEAQIQAKKAKALEVSEEIAGMMTPSLAHFGAEMAVTAKRDGLPATSSYRRRTRPQPTEGTSIKDMRAWAANTGWVVPFGEFKGKQIGEWKNRLPNEVKSALLDDYNKAN